MGKSIKKELEAFCEQYGYTYHCGFNKKKEYEIIISKGEHNAGAFLTQEELDNLTERKLRDLLKLLHQGFKERFKN